MQSLRDNPEHFEIFNHEAYNEIYKKIIKMIDEEESFENFMSSFENCDIFSPSYIDTFSLINKFIEFLNYSCCHITNCGSLNERIKKYLEEQL